MLQAISDTVQLRWGKKSRIVLQQIISGKGCQPSLSLSWWFSTSDAQSQTTFLALPSPSPAFLSLCPPRHSCLFRPNFLLTAVAVVQFGLGCPVCRFIRYHTNVGALLKGISYYAATDKRHGLLSSGKWKKKHSPSSLIYLIG